MTNKWIFIYIGMISAFMITTGIVLPWVVNNILMPSFMIILSLSALSLFWLIIFNKIKDLFKKDNKNAS